MENGDRMSVRKITLPSAEAGFRYDLSDNESRRIDVCRLIAIIAVVMQHASLTGEKVLSYTAGIANHSLVELVQIVLSDLIGSLGVPMFFFISAILLFRSAKPYKTTLKKKITTLLIPYLIWNTLWVFIYWFFQGIQLTKGLFSNPENMVRDFGVADWLEAYGIFGGGVCIYRSCRRCGFCVT